MTRKIVSEFRLRQADAIQRGRQRLSERHPDDPRLPEIDALMARVVGARIGERLSDDDFIQVQQLPELILQAVQHACLRYSEPEWDSDFERFRFVFNAKHPDRLKAGERYVNEGLELMLGSTKRFTLDLPLASAGRPTHAFRAFDHDDGEHTLLSELLANREWRPSQQDACLQLADVIAGTVRSVIERGEASPRMQPYNTLRTVIADENGYCLHFYRFRGAPLPDL
jgi:hypothetical protein